MKAIVLPELMSFISPLTSNPVFIILLFLAFVVMLKKLKSLTFNILWIIVAAVLFPVVMNKAFSFAIATDIDSILLYMTAGIGAYVLYLAVKSMLGIGSLLGKLLSPITHLFGSRDKRVDKLLKNKKKEEKAKKEEEKKKREEERRFEEISRKSQKQRKNEEEYLELADKDKK